MGGTLVRKHPAPEGALRRVAMLVHHEVVGGQKAPSTRRCIKTKVCSSILGCINVRKHPAPEGALRLNLQECRDIAHNVRKHPAPEGALRPRGVNDG